MLMEPKIYSIYIFLKILQEMIVQRKMYFPTFFGIVFHATLGYGTILS